MNYVLKAPLPGTVLDIKVREGQNVDTNDVVLILEAMKMENEISAGYSGKVTKIMVGTGDTVKMGDTLIEFE